MHVFEKDVIVPSGFIYTVFEQLGLLDMKSIANHVCAKNCLIWSEPLNKTTQKTALMSFVVARPVTRC